MSKNGNIIVSVGTAGCCVGARMKTQIQKDPKSFNEARFLAIDGGWDDPTLQSLSDSEKVDLAGAAIADLKANAEDYGSIFDEVILERLDSDTKLSGAGRLIPTVMYAAYLFKVDEFRTKLTAHLRDLLGAEKGLEAVEIWVVSSISSTTGRGCLLPTLFASHNVIREAGVEGMCTIDVVIMDSEGLVPDRREEREKIEAGSWRELERVMCSDRPNFAIPTPEMEAHEWIGKSPARFIFRRNSKRQRNNLGSLDALLDSTSDWLLHTSIRPEVAEHLSGRRGDRTRVLPRLGLSDGNRPDPKHRYLSVANVAAVDVSAPSLKAFALSRGSDEVLDRLIGETGTAIGRLAVELQLGVAGLRNRLEEGSAITLQIKKALGRLRKSLAKNKQKSWRGHIEVLQSNMDSCLLSARQVVPGRRKRLEQEILGQIRQRANNILRSSSPDGLGEDEMEGIGGIAGRVDYLEDVKRQLTTLRSEANDVMTTAKGLDVSNQQVARTLGNLSLWRKGAQQDQLIEELERCYSDAVARLIADHTIRLADHLGREVDTLLGNSRKSLLVATGAKTLMREMRDESVRTLSDSALVKPLLGGMEDFESVIRAQGLLLPNTLEVVKGALLEHREFSDSLDPLLHLGRSSVRKLAEMTCSLYRREASVDRLDELSFKELFEARYDNEPEQQELFKWMATTAEPLGGHIDEGYAQKIPSALRPACVELTKILAPPDMIELVKKCMKLEGISEVCFVAVEGLTSILCIKELHGLPPWAFTYLRTIDGRLPDNASERSLFVATKWAQEWLPSLRPGTSVSEPATAPVSAEADHRPLLVRVSD